MRISKHSGLHRLCPQASTASKGRDKKQENTMQLSPSQSQCSAMICEYLLHSASIIATSSPPQSHLSSSALKTKITTQQSKSECTVMMPFFTLKHSTTYTYDRSPSPSPSASSSQSSQNSKSSQSSIRSIQSFLSTTFRHQHSQRHQRRQEAEEAELEGLRAAADGRVQERLRVRRERERRYEPVREANKERRRAWDEHMAMKGR